MCANWEEIQVGRHIERIGVESFGVKSLGSHFKFPENRGRKYKWFLDSKNKVVKVEFNNKYTKVCKEMLGIPSFVKKYFKEKDAIVFRDENAIYLCPYALGQEHLERFLRSEKVVTRL